MNVEAIAQVVGALVCGVLFGGWLVKLLVDRQFKAWDAAIQENRALIVDHKRSARVEIGSILSKMDTVERAGLERNDETRRQVTGILETLPREYARHDTILDLRNRMESLENKIENGFARISHQMQQILTEQKRQ